MYRPVRRRGLALGLLIVVSFTGGCGGAGKPLKVAGTIKWSDGSPVEGVVVVFAAASEGGRDANGITADDGRFELTTYSFGDGALPGDYKILVTRPEQFKNAEAAVQGENPTEKMKNWFNAKKKAASAPPPSKDAIPLAYTKVETTPLRWNVASGNTSPELKIQKRK